MIDLGDLLRDLVGVALREAAGHHELLRAAVLVLRHLEDGVDALLLGRIDERARVHDDHVGVARLGRDLVPRLLGEPQHHLAIDEVLGAAERNQTDLQNNLFTRHGAFTKFTKITKITKSLCGLCGLRELCA